MTFLHAEFGELYETQSGENMATGRFCDFCVKQKKVYFCGKLYLR